MIVHPSYRSAACRCACLAIAVSFPAAPCREVNAREPRADTTEALDCRIELTTARQGFDGKTCWVHARTGRFRPTHPATRPSGRLW